jgi:hypothetical protein
MADLFAVGTGSWSSTAIWATVSGGATGHAIPTNADRVFLDSNTGTITINTSAVCSDFSMTGGTITGTSALNIAGSAVFGGTVSGYTGGITFSSTATGKTITSNGRALGSFITFDGVGGGWTLADAFVTSSTINLLNGAFSDGGFIVTAGVFNASSSTTARSVTKTTEWVITGVATCVNFGTVTSLTATMSGGWKLTDASSSTRTFATGGLTFGGTVKVTAGTGSFTFTGAGAVIGGLDLTGYAGPFGNANFTCTGSIVLGSATTSADGTGILTWTSSGAATFTSNGAAFNHPIVINGTGSFTLQDALNLGVRPLTLTQGSFNDNGFSVTLSHFVCSGAVTRSLTKTGNWTFNNGQAAASVVNIATTGLTTSFDVTKSWIFSNSGSTAINATFGGLVGVGHLKVTAGTYALTLTTANGAGGTFNDIDFTGFAGSISSSGNAVNFTGSLTLGASMTFTSFNGNAFTMIVATGQTKTITSHGVVIGRQLTFSGVGNVQLADPLNVSFTITHTSGGFSDNGFTLTAANYSCNNSNTRSVTKTTQWTLTGTGVCVDFTTTTGLTISATGGWLLTDSSATSRTFATGGLVFSGAVKVNAGTGSFTLSQSSAGSVGGVDFTGFAGTLAAGVLLSTGDIVLGTGMTVTDTSNALSMIGSGTMKFTSNGVTFNRPLVINGTGTVVLQDAYSSGARGITHTAGGLNDNGFSVTTFSFSSNNSNVRSLTKTANWTITGTGTCVTFFVTTNLTTSLSGGWTLTDSSATTRNFVSGGLSFGGTLTIAAGSMTQTISGSGTFGGLVFADAFTGSWTLSLITLTGSLRMSAGMSVAATAGLTIANTTGTATITSNGVTLGATSLVIASSATAEIADNLNLGTGQFVLTSGTFNSNNHAMAFSNFSANSTGTLNLGTSTVTVTGFLAGNNNAWNASLTAYTINAANAIINITDNTTAVKNFNANSNHTYGTINFQGKGTLYFGNANGGLTCGTLTGVAGNDQTFTFREGTSISQQVGAFNINGSSGHLTTVNSRIPGTRAVVRCSSGAFIFADYLKVQDLDCGPGYWFAGDNSQDLGNNVGIGFASAQRASITVLEG